MADTFDPYYEWLAIPPEEQPPHHYRLLGLKLFEDKPTIIEHAADRQMGHLRNFQAGKHGALSQKLLNEIAAARVCLLNPQKKAAYDAMLREQLQPAAEDTSSQDRFARELADVVGSAGISATARATASRSAKRMPPVLMIGGIAAAVVVLGVVVWTVMGRGKTEVAQKAESGAFTERTQPKAEGIPNPQGSSPKAEDLAETAGHHREHREHRGTQREDNKNSSSVLSV